MEETTKSRHLQDVIDSLKPRASSPMPSSRSVSPMPSSRQQSQQQPQQQQVQSQYVGINSGTPKLRRRRTTRLYMDDSSDCLLELGNDENESEDDSSSTATDEIEDV